MIEAEIRTQIKFHENEIYRLTQLLPKSREVQNLKSLGKNEIFKLRARKIDSELTKMIEVEDKSHLFCGKIVVITGEFPSFNSRNDMAKMLQSVGADVNTAISLKTDYVIVGQKAGPKKLEAIEKFSIKTFSEHDFIKMF